MTVNAVLVAGKHLNIWISQAHVGQIGTTIEDNGGNFSFYQLIIDHKEEYLCFNCEIYLMNDDGKTVEIYH